MSIHSFYTQNLIPLLVFIWWVCKEMERFLLWWSLLLKIWNGQSWIPSLFLSNTQLKQAQNLSFPHRFPIQDWLCYHTQKKKVQSCEESARRKRRVWDNYRKGIADQSAISNRDLKSKRWSKWPSTSRDSFFEYWHLSLRKLIGTYIEGRWVNKYWCCSTLSNQTLPPFLNFNFK